MATTRSKYNPDDRTFRDFSFNGARGTVNTEPSTWQGLGRNAPFEFHETMGDDIEADPPKRQFETELMKALPLPTYFIKRQEAAVNNPAPEDTKYPWFGGRRIRPGGRVAINAMPASSSGQKW